MKSFCLVLVVAFAGYSLVGGHVRLRNPPSRASLWREPEFDVYQPEHDYEDNQGFCGGFQHQFEVNGGLCGICGDPYDQAQPRDHEGGGLYGRGIITRNYTEGQVIDVTVELTASHLGYFELKLCPHNNPLVPVEQSCLDQYPLELVDGSGSRFYINDQAAKPYYYQVKLPQGVTCRQCVVQLHYNTGNSWGVSKDGESCMGCGAQETFRSCADVKISA